MQVAKVAMLRNLHGWADRPRRLRGTALLRVGFGIAALHYYISNFRDRHFIWGPEGVIGYSSFMELRNRRLAQWSLFGLSDSSQVFELLLAAAIVIAILLILVGGRSLTLLHAVFIISLIRRNVLAGDGGDNLAQVVLPFVALTTNNAHFSLVAHSVRARISRLGPMRELINMVHNSAVTIIVTQITIVYAMASFWKLGGPHWQNGTALYYILNNDEFQFLRVADWMVENPFLITIMTYGAIAAQLSIAPTVITRKFTEFAVMAVISMHIGIASTMGLVGFSLNMIAADLVLLTDWQYDQMGKRVKFIVLSFRRSGRERSGAEAVQ